MKVRKIDDLTLMSGLFIGLFQILAFLPGTSRSGITITASRFLGFERSSAAKISLLLSIPAILGATTLEVYDLYLSIILLELSLIHISEHTRLGMIS